MNVLKLDYPNPQLGEHGHSAAKASCIMATSSKTVPPAVVGSWPPLHDAIWRASSSHDLTQLRAVLQSGADIAEVSNSHGWTNATVLHTAADGNIELFDLLLENGATELLKNKCGPGEEGRSSGQTVLQSSAKHGRTKIAQRLIAVGADYDTFSAIALEPVSKPVCSHQKERKAFENVLIHRLSFLLMAFLARKLEF